MHPIVRTWPVLSILATCCAVVHATAEPVEPGIERQTLQLTARDGSPPTNVWVYRSPAWQGDAPRACVLIAASGSNGLTGALLDDSQESEHLPYVRAGCIVVAYDVAGAITADTDPQQYTARIRDFMNSQGGVKSAQAALDAAIGLNPRIDTNRLFAAGHGSGANVALLLAARDERIRAVAAFSPLGDVLERIGKASIEAMDTALPGFDDFLTSTQPAAVADEVHCPTMLFHPLDDEISPAAETQQLAEAMKTAGNPPQMDEPRTGGHVEGMLGTGLQRAADWFGELAKRIPTTQPVGTAKK